MKTIVLPKTCIGKWALGLSIAFIVLIAMKIQGSLPMPTYTITALGLTGFAMGIVAILRNRDRGILNYMAITVGVVIIAWITTELILRH